jgi:sialate O-acetylesterase
MVLQQNTRVRLWGEASPREAITIRASWSASASAFTATANASGSFDALIPTPGASYAPHTLNFTSSTSNISLTDVLIGEVFLASGQSNMELPLDGFKDCPVKGSNLAILTCGKYSGIRMVVLQKNASAVPLDYVPKSWEAAAPAACARWSAAAFWFAVTLQRALAVPIGVIVSAWGGARVEGFMPREVLVGLGENLSQVWAKDWERPMQAYNSLIWPVRRYTIRGFLWYQGEANVAWPGQYAARLAVMAEHWRALWGIGNLPFFFVEIAPYVYGTTGSSGALLREAQFHAQFLIPNSGIVTTNDLVSPLEWNQIHPENKEAVGQRLAFLALNRLYGMASVAADSPAFERFVVNGTHAIVYFTNAEMGLSPWSGIRGFELANESRHFVPATAVRADDGNGRSVIDVYAQEVGQPVAVRYCFRDFLIGNLYNHRQLAVFPFRSDNWTVAPGVRDSGPKFL